MDLKDYINISSLSPAQAKEQLQYLFPYNTESCRLTVMCTPSHYCASELARAVEDADAHLLNLNITTASGPEGQTIIELRISHRDAGRAAASLQRYGYTVTDISQEGYDRRAEMLQNRINDLLTRINV